MPRANPVFPSEAIWENVQQKLASRSGLAILLIEGHQPPEISISHNNSLCHFLQSSSAHAHLCDPYCGEAYKRALEAGEKTEYRCHAGLKCFTMPVRINDRQLAVIGGRAFVRTSDYEGLSARLRDGDLSDLSIEDVLRNLIFCSDGDLDELAHRIGNGPEIAEAAEGPTTLSARGDSGNEAIGENMHAHELSVDVDALAGGTLGDAADTIEKLLQERFRIVSAALLFRHDGAVRVLCSTGAFKENPYIESLDYTDLLSALQSGQNRVLMFTGAGSAAKRKYSAKAFPLKLAGEVKGALLIDQKNLKGLDEEQIVQFCSEASILLEILRLRHELSQRSRMADQLSSLTNDINEVEPEEAYSTILRYSVEILEAERGSLLLFDEEAKELAMKALVGPHAEVARETRIPVGEGIAGLVWKEGKPLVVRDLVAEGRNPAPAERNYKTKSFISYPIIVGGRRVGVVNVTDKVNGDFYDEADLNLLKMITPQVALAIDRVEWHQKATEFQLLSITDPLTGLLNRRYLEERLSEELERSKRHRFGMSFLMLDIDDFKHYNDRNGHQAGDFALEMTAQCLKSALRSADVASRYGGEEFSILLPQTSSTEAQVIAERIRRRVRRSQFPHGSTQPLGAVTVSIGISSFSPRHDNAAAIIGAADHALYLAKHGGKDRVENASSLPVDPRPPRDEPGDQTKHIP